MSITSNKFFFGKIILIKSYYKIYNNKLKINIIRLNLLNLQKYYTEVKNIQNNKQIKGDENLEKKLQNECLLYVSKTIYWNLIISDYNKFLVAYFEITKSQKVYF